VIETGPNAIFLQIFDTSTNHCRNIDEAVPTDELPDQQLTRQFPQQISKLSQPVSLPSDIPICIHVKLTMHAEPRVILRVHPRC
jgi:hypothetical protein